MRGFRGKGRDILTKQLQAKLRVCASCEWIFKSDGSCPQCGFASYGAHWVYRRKAYKFSETQEPWKIIKRFQHERKLNVLIEKSKREVDCE